MCSRPNPVREANRGDQRDQRRRSPYPQIELNRNDFIYRYITNVGKTYHGNELTVRDERGEAICSHKTTDTYRHNTEVAAWIIARLAGKQERWLH